MAIGNSLQHDPFGTTVVAAATVQSIATALLSPTPLLSLGVPLTTFHLFTKLPMELQIIIWKMTLQPRVVEIHYCGRCSFRSPSKVPTALQVCHNSRAGMISFYPLSFGSIFKKPRIRFNFMLDTIYFHQGSDHLFHFFDMMRKSKVDKIRYVAISDKAGLDTGNFENEEEYWRMVGSYVAKMRRLKQISVTLNMGDFVDEPFWDEFESSQGNSTFQIELLKDIPVEIQQRPELKLPAGTLKRFHMDYIAKTWPKRRFNLRWEWRAGLAEFVRGQQTH